MKWRKLGQLFVSGGQFPWMASHAAGPFAEHLEGDIFRIYFTSRDTNNRSHISSCVLDIARQQVLECAQEPVLSPGEPGLFDDSGTAMGCLLKFDGQTLLYYLGWNLKVTVPWLNTIGLAVWNPATSKFEKQSRAPVMDRSNEDPFSISYPSILVENGRLRMWYGSNLSWGPDQSDMAHVIKAAASKDGVVWERNSRTALGLEHPGEYALSKPCVLLDPDGYRAWYSFRANGDIETYRIGYAFSEDGDNWKRQDDQAGIDISPSGWDSEMICYPHVFDHNGVRHMLYNGNGYGRTGFGLAIQT